MTRRYVFAVAIGIAAMVIAAAPPLWVRLTGDEVFLAVVPIDPLSLFRGNYVDLDYSLGDLDDDVRRLERGSSFWVVFDEGRPATPASVHESRPHPSSGQFCIEGYVRNGPRFPSLEQYFLPRSQALELERGLGGQLARVSVTGGCDAVLIDVVPR